MSLPDVLLGKPLTSEEETAQKIGPIAGIPVLGLDALSSAAYGPEAALTLLLPLGAAGLRYIAPISFTIIGLLVIVYFSYRQTIAAYPGGGGSYTVAKENLGIRAGLLAAAALSLDYVLNVAVGISAGVGALVSAFPALQPYTLALCLGVLALLTLVNLRGLREAGFAFMAPTYVFAGSLLTVLGVGLAKVWMAAGHPVAAVPPPALPPPAEAAGAWRVLRAFASGCTAMTGVEAVSNAVPVFRKPTVRLAQRTLTGIIALLIALLGGLALLCRAYGLGATPAGSAGYQSVLSQVVAAVMGRGAFYYVTMAAIFSVLALSANTSFADFPRLCRVLALDHFLPRAFSQRGRRLAFSHGILVLASLAGALLVAFGGLTDRLIPLFAVGAFLAFTLSQAGMVAHWLRQGGGRRAVFSLLVNGLGALATGATLLVVIVSKFTEGAWLTLLAIPTVLFLYRSAHRHYQQVESETAAPERLDCTLPPPPIVVVPLRAWDRMTHKALRFALQLSPDVHAVHIYRETEVEALTGHWEKRVVEPAVHAGLTPPKLTVLPSKYRRFYTPLLVFLHRLADENPGREVAVIVPELVVRRWYHALLHNHKAEALKALLLVRGGPRFIVINAPWYLKD